MLQALSTIWMGCWQLFSMPASDMVSLTAVAALAVLAVLAAGALRRVAGIGGGSWWPSTSVQVAPRQAHAVPKHSDPDAAGRARPRAPTTSLAA